jgi:hypothetical protein
VTPPRWVLGLYESHNEHEALDAMFDAVDDHCLAGEWAEVDTALASIDVTRISPVLAVGLLSITRMARHHLFERERVARAIVDHLRTTMTDERVERITGGLL